MKSCKVLQIVFGVFCAILAMAVGLTSVMLILPYLNVELDMEFFATMHDGLDAVAEDLGFGGHSWIVLCIAFVVPTILFVVSTILLVRGKKGKTVVAGGIVAVVAVGILAILVALFSKLLFGDLQATILWVLLSAVAICVLLYCLTKSAVKGAKVAEQTDGEPSNDTTTQPSTESCTNEAVTDTTTQPSTEEGMLYMPSDYGSVGDVADQTYEQNDVLSPKVLEKLKIARDLYEKGALTKDEYLALVGKYINQ